MRACADGEPARHGREESNKSQNQSYPEQPTFRWWILRSKAGQRKASAVLILAISEWVIGRGGRGVEWRCGGSLSTWQQYHQSLHIGIASSHRSGPRPVPSTYRVVHDESPREGALETWREEEAQRNLAGIMVAGIHDAVPTHIHCIFFPNMDPACPKLSVLVHQFEGRRTNPKRGAHGQ